MNRLFKGLLLSVLVAGQIAVPSMVCANETANTVVKTAMDVAADTAKTDAKQCLYAIGGIVKNLLYTIPSGAYAILKPLERGTKELLTNPEFSAAKLLVGAGLTFAIVKYGIIPACSSNTAKKVKSYFV